MYCIHCGKEINENAFVCTGCGALVKKPPKQKIEVESKDESEIEYSRSEKRLKIWMGISIVLLFFSAFLFAVSGSTYLYFATYDSSRSYSYIRDGAYLATGGFINAILALGASTTGFVLGLKEKQNFNLKFTSICLFAVSVFLFIFGIIMVSY